MSADGATVVLAHGLGGSGDLPVPYAYAMVGAAWALTFTFALVFSAWRRPRFDPQQAGPPVADGTDHAGRRQGDPLDGRRAGAGLRGVGGVRRAVGAAIGVERSAGCVLCAAVGRAGGAVVGSRTGLAGDLPGAHGVSAAAACHAGATRSTAAVLSRRLGISPRRAGPVRLRLDGTGEPELGVAAFGQGVAVGLCRGDAGRGVAVRAALAGPGRPVRRVQHGGVPPLAVSPQSGHRQDRRRQSARPPAVAARSARRGRAAGGAARVDGVRQLLVIPDLARVRRSAFAHRWCIGHAVVVAVANGRADRLHFRCGGDVFACRARYRRCRP